MRKLDRRIPDGLRQALVNYLAVRPYHEVYEFIPALESLEPIKELKPSDDGKETTEPTAPG